ncbi:MAG TPA: hypothetical protein VLH38_02120 [Patescibacteria group bacterium]|nr:hypothetical protein [Patescibacteria group bacterium]
MIEGENRPETARIGADTIAEAVSTALGRYEAQIGTTEGGRGTLTLYGERSSDSVTLSDSGGEPGWNTVHAYVSPKRLGLEGVAYVLHGMRSEPSIARLGGSDLPHALSPETPSDPQLARLQRLIEGTPVRPQGRVAKGLTALFAKLPF